MLVRILRGIGAHIFNNFIMAAMQIATVPALISTWGVERYGVWLILFTVPAYAALSDLGFVTAAANDMTMSAAKGHQDLAVCTFQSSWTIVSAITAGLFLAGLAITTSLPSAWLPGAGLVSDTEIRLTIVFFLLYAVAIIHGTIILGGFRCSGHYALGVVLWAVMCLVEGLALILAVIVSGKFAVGALALFIGRTVGVACMAVILRGTARWLKFGFGNATLAEVTRLVRPSLAGMAIPLANAVYIQGMVIVLGAVIGPSAVPAFSVVRTLTRFGFQAAANVNLSVMPEFSAASAQGDKLRQARLFAFSSIACTAITVSAAVLIMFGGPSIIRVWSGGHIVPSQSLLFLMSVVMVLNTAWYFTSNLLLAINRHGSYSGIYLMASSVAVLLAIPMSRAMGTNGAALTLIGFEMIMIIYIYHAVAKVHLVDWSTVLLEVRRGLRMAKGYVL